MKFLRLEHNDLPLPRRATYGSAGFDFHACLMRPCYEPSTGKWFSTGPEGRDYDHENAPVSKYPLHINPHESIRIPLGFISSFENSLCLKIYIRSSLASKGLMLVNSVGVVDSDYRNELMAELHNRTDHVITIDHGERIVQGLLEHINIDDIEEVTDIDKTERNGGFGSTGNR